MDEGKKEKSAVPGEQPTWDDCENGLMTWGQLEAEGLTWK